MAEESGHGNFLWETQSWAFSNSDNSGGSEEKSSKKPLESTSNSPTAVAATASRKRGRNGNSKDVKGSGGGGGGSGAGAGAGDESDHEIHIWTERERRKKMRNMFSNLHALLPQLPPKADKSSIVDEAVGYIKSLQLSLQNLQKQRLQMLRGGAGVDYDVSIVAPPPNQPIESREAFLADRVSSKNWTIINSPLATVSIPRFPSNSFQTWSSPNVVLSISGEDAHINVCTSKKPGLLATIFYVLEKHNLEVLTAHISSDYYRCTYMIHAHANGISDQFEEILVVEEIYKLAVGEILFWLSS